MLSSYDDLRFNVGQRTSAKYNLEKQSQTRYLSSLRIWMRNILLDAMLQWRVMTLFGANEKKWNFGLIMLVTTLQSVTGNHTLIEFDFGQKHTCSLRSLIRMDSSSRAEASLATSAFPLSNDPRSFHRTVSIEYYQSYNRYNHIKWDCPSKMQPAPNQQHAPVSVRLSKPHWPHRVVHIQTTVYGIHVLWDCMGMHYFQ